MNTQKLLLSMAIFSLSITANAATLTLTDGKKLISSIDSSNIYEGMKVTTETSFIKEVVVYKSGEKKIQTVGQITEGLSFEKVVKNGENVDIFACLDVLRKFGQVRLCKEFQITENQDAQINFGDILTTTGDLI